MTIHPTLSQVTRYLKVNGWLSTRTKIDGLNLFTKVNTEFGELEIFLPASPYDISTKNRVEQALETLAALNQISRSEQSAHIRRMSFDIVDASVPNTATYKDTIKLGTAEVFIKQTRLMMTSAAAMHFDFSSESNSEQHARTYINSCRFAHTFQRSFGFRVLSPLGKRPDKDLGLDIRISPPPPERFITQRLARGIKAAMIALQHRTTEPIVDIERDGINSDGYDALARLLSRAEAPVVTFDFTFSPEWGVADDLVRQAPLVLRTDGAQLLREAAEKLRAKPPTNAFAVQGYVVRLTSHYLPDDILHPGGRVVGIRCDNEDLGEITISVVLNPDEYFEALHAHERGREVQVVGVVEGTNAGGFRLTHKESFRVV